MPNVLTTDSFLLGEEESAFATQTGDGRALSGIRFIVTVDADTRLPSGCVNKLAATLAHPLNRARFDPETGRIRSGYSVIQPRVEISPESGMRSLFARLYTGDTAIDIYSRAVSDVYQDLFGEGIFTGKGIYELEAFHRSADGHAPENAILSHDLFEGILGRAALATDIVLYEGFPASYTEYIRRWHRWVRGDWQLLPWLLPYMKALDGSRLRNPFSRLDRWKIIDNLRRSLVAPSLILFAITGWLFLPGSPWLWTILAALAPAGYLFTDLVSGLARGRRRSAIYGTFAQFSAQAERWFLAIVFLPKEAATALHAIGVVLWRMAVSRRHLLEWTSAAHIAARSARQRSRAAIWRDMWAGPALSVILTLALVAMKPGALPAAAPFLILWLLSAEAALWIRRPLRHAPAPLDGADRKFLRMLARRTWLYFETFAGPEDNWLPPDNYQEEPYEEIAHRTSPTNIGMMLLSNLTAFELGHAGAAELAARTTNCFAALDRLERYRGHFLNWYDTRSLKPLEPRYVSTVDSGNLAVCLITLAAALEGAATVPLFDARRWDGFIDVLDLVDEALEKTAAGVPNHLHAALDAFRKQLLDTRDAPQSWRPDLATLNMEAHPAIEALFMQKLESGTGLPAATQRDVAAWIARLGHQLRAMQRDFDEFAPWLVLAGSPPGGMEVVAQPLSELFQPNLTDDTALKCRDFLRSFTVEDDAGRQWITDLTGAIDTGLERQQQLRTQLRQLSARAHAMAYAMDFTPLYNEERRLFHIGYNLSSDRIDQHYYDLLATEARLASYFAIAKGDVPLEHWFFLGRPLTRDRGGLTLFSWNGSMFEYLMPPLFLRGGPHTLLGESERIAVGIQRRYSQRHGIPWGISESAFASRDPEHRYRYQAFGVPGLGLRRDLGRNMVIAPYASALALPVEPGQAVANLRQLWQQGAGGLYGLFEAADFTSDRVNPGSSFTPVRAYMAHHQGMILCAIGNALCEDIFVRRFRSDPHMRAADLLLSERIPREVPSEIDRVEEQEALPQRAQASRPPLAWTPGKFGTFPQAHMLGNGRFASWISEAGGGGLAWRRRALTRFVPDATRDDSGLWIYVSDDEDGSLWSATRQPTGAFADEYQVTFHPHMAEFHRRDHGIALRMEVATAHGDDVELRRVTVVNEGARARSLRLTSYGEVVLAPPLEDERHPAFSKLFVFSEYLPAQGGLLFTRRPRHAHEGPPVLLHRLIGDEKGIGTMCFETDRRSFLGRNGTPARPEGLGTALSGNAGWTLDPVMALQAQVQLAPHESRELCFLTIAAGSVEAALETTDRYATLASVNWAINDAAAAAARETQRLGLEPELLPELQALASLLLYPEPVLRAAPLLIHENRLGQPHLWGLGLSGDRPILLLKLNHGDDHGLLRHLAMGHQLWRDRGIEIDLVILKAAASGYLEPVRDQLLGLLHDVGAHEYLGRHGGIHLLSSDQIGPESTRLLEVAARVVLDDGHGPLSRQFAAARPARREIPVMEPSGEAETDPNAPLERPKDLLFDNGLGGFSADGREYVLHLEPGERTPAPWSNILANDGFGCLLTEAGGGFTWAVNSGENRLTPWSNDPVADMPGELLYLRDEESTAVWTIMPFGADDTACQVRHGAGYTRWLQNAHGLEQELLVFVPIDEPVKLIRLRVRNDHPRARRITATYYAQWQLGALKSVSSPHVVAEYDPASRALLARNPWNPDFGDRVAFLTSSAEPHGVTVDREEFIGRDGDLRRPAALRRWGLSDNVAPGADPCAAYQVHIDLAAGEEQELVFVLGQGEDRKKSLALARRWQDPEMAARALVELQMHWDRLLNAVQVHTPDPAFDMIMNRWLLYQTLSSRILARAGFYQAGGAIGFRDQLQDMLACLHADPARVRAHILTCAAHQFEEGDVLHWWHPPTDRGVRTRCSDDLIWLPYVVSRYVEATGDTALLDEMIPYLHAPPLAPDEGDRYSRFETTSYQETLLDHCVRALERSALSGGHGLPLMGSGDWNDGMDRIGAEGRGESVWLAWFFIVTLEDFTALAHGIGRDDLVARWHERIAHIRQAAEDAGWDGHWYRRAFDDDGDPWGSVENDECRIDSISQSWAALAGADSVRVREALDMAFRELVVEDRRIVRLLTPPFEKTPREPGYIKAYPPGVRENGGQYTHAAAWLGFAFAHIGDGERAYQIFDLLNPIHLAPDRVAAEHYRLEPYVLAADIADGGPRTGRGGWSWYTGSSAWFWRLGLEAILGLRRWNGGIVLAPCLPKHWGGCTLRLQGPAGTLAIQVDDPQNLGAGEVELTVDGQSHSAGEIRFPTDGTTSQVVAIICAPGRSD